MIEGRRRFLKWLAVLPLAPLTSGRTEATAAVTGNETAKQNYLLNVFSVAGFQYHEGMKLISQMQTGERLALKAEPGNPYDKFAVRIERRGATIGYVPRSDNRHIHRLLRQGARLTCRVVEVNRQAPTWHQVRVEVVHRV